ncbi:MAG: hypothetical protein V1709_10335 [Planctomycetota bacterium]
MKKSALRQFTTGIGKQIAIGIVLLLALLTVVVMTCDIINMRKCSICGDITIGKQEAINDKPVCEKCYYKE